ncbi:hypothetical protein D9619_009662 [Psilocybe cf. subviscida]|uniref:Chromatin modification-related protein EAF3 n=1 Tax=Psilocybe cf. subviscida TaxID=2480587 RepID=A0A8H5F613_9AGAR|nr:hypothetical protein D9619_009662 [Psilocybe cf. subviscida]
MSTATATTTPTYVAQEHVLCYHGPLIYEAKVLKTKTYDEASTTTGVVGPHYLVHYKGWKQTWDEWVPAARLLKRNDANLAMQKQLQLTNTAAAAGGSGASKAHNKGPAGGGKGDNLSSRTGARKDGGGTRGTKRAREEDDNSKRTEMKLVIPEVLKGILVDDWENVTKNQQVCLSSFFFLCFVRSFVLHPASAFAFVHPHFAFSRRGAGLFVASLDRLSISPSIYLYTHILAPPTSLVTLPRDPTVVELLDQFAKYVRETKPPHLKEPLLTINTIIDGLTAYFDRALGATLLYRFERVQYAYIRKQYWTGQDVVVGQEREMSAIYGAEHLVRMLGAFFASFVGGYVWDRADGFFGGVVSLPQMIANTSLDPESIALIRDYVNELMSCVAFSLSSFCSFAHLFFPFLFSRFVPHALLPKRMINRDIELP